MRLYIQAYGLSVLRVATLWGMLMILCALIACLLKCLVPSARVCPALTVLALCTWTALNFGNVDHLYPFVFAGPYVGIGMGIFGNKTTAEQLKQDLKALEYGLGIGVGIDLWILQLTAKYNWNFGRIADATKVPQLEGSPRIIEICVGLNF